MAVISAGELLTTLKGLHLENKVGRIKFEMANVSVKIDTTDTVGITLQAWLKQFFIDNNIYYQEPANTQEFPDFFLNNASPYDHMLEVKAFNYDATPAFDIANFESYCASVKEKPYRLNADYLIFGYVMKDNGDIYVKKLWLHKIWEIAGTSERFALKTQVKRDMIYNIRPNSDFKNDRVGPFRTKEAFVKAIYDTLKVYKGESFANSWKSDLQKNYLKYFHSPINF